MIIDFDDVGGFKFCTWWLDVKVDEFLISGKKRICQHNVNVNIILNSLSTEYNNHNNE